MSDNNSAMKFPYGISDFNKIITEDYFYCDRTDRIRTLESAGNSLLFLRPRRFGKSLLLSMLANYYDLAKADSFEKLFGNLLIGRNPTKLHNKYFILKWDFSRIDPFGNIEDIKRALYDYINRTVKKFRTYYKDYLIPEIEINKNNALDSISALTDAVSTTDYSIYLLIDEYDNFANEVMMSDQRNKDNYEALVYGDGLLKTLFKTIKALAGESLFDRTFITGVSPVIMSDITSGYNIAKNIYLDTEFNDLCGFTEKEIADALKQITDKCGYNETKAEDALDIMREYYNGYSFDYKAKSTIYNPTLALYFFDRFHNNCEYPEKMLDGNLAADEAKLEYIAGIPGGGELLLSLPENDNQIVISELEERFGIKRILDTKTKDFTFMASFLYYFGVLTMAGKTEAGELILKTPNLVVQSLYVDIIREMLLPESLEKDEGVNAAKKLYQKGDIKPVCDFIEQKYFQVFSNRDYISANELTVKTAFLTLLYNNILYIMDSEPETGRGYADLTMIIRPDMRQYKILDILLEFKFVHLKEAGMTGEQAKQLRCRGGINFCPGEQAKQLKRRGGINFRPKAGRSGINFRPGELEAIPEMQKKMKEAEKQLVQYGAALENKHKNLRLKKFAVVALGFERLWTKEVHS